MNANESVLQYEILEEKALSLGRAARQFQDALLLLSKHKSGEPNAGPRRELLLADAADKVYFFLIQRELCGMRDWDEVLEFYRIPGDVVKRLGSWRKPSGS